MRPAELRDALTKHISLSKVERVIRGKPDTTVILTKEAVIRVPHDKLSATRCRVNALMLKKLSQTSIAGSVPRF